EIEKFLNKVSHTLQKVEKILKELALLLNKPELSKENPRKLLCTFLLLMLHDDEWRYYYYFPACVVSWEAVGSFAIASREPLPKEFIESWSHITDIFFTPLTIVDRERKVLRHALKSAIAAIMSRNMSHMHGSHIHANLQTQIDTLIDPILNALENYEKRSRRDE
ncbi:hypothetical protein J7L87_04305, partial [bacterium]|nr:hypothetical protein [bacterium]